MSINELPHIPKLSIVVATYRRPDHLANLLKALREQTASPADFEIIVVDNENQPNPQVQALCTSTQYPQLALRYIHHAQVGSSSARNRGLQEAHGEMVAFLDDDILPPPGWITQVFKTRANSQAEIFGGPYTPFYTSPPPRWFRDKYAGLNFGNRAHWLARKKYLSAGNTIWSRTLVLDLGGFSEDYGGVGNKKRYGEDSELCQRAYEKGFGIWYDSSLSLRHHCTAERMSVRWQMASIIRHSQMKARLVLRETRTTDTRPVFWKILSILRKFVFQVIRFLIICCMAPFRKREKYPYMENYIMEKIGPELRQVALLFEMISSLLSDNDETQRG
jgi:glycosyltransferase involved in cell wall biosynthesis